VENRLVPPAGLRALQAAGALVIDARPADEFARGQIAGAVHLDLWGVSLIDTSEAPLRAFAWMIGHLFALRGVEPDRPVVVYEDQAGMRAARVFWWLEYLGHESAHVLDGGLKAWIAEGLPLATEPIAPRAGTWHGSPAPERIATWRDVQSRLGDLSVVIIDTRSSDEYSGRVARARRGGSIPGARHLEWSRNLDENGRFKPADELRRMYEEIGATPDRDIITYCQGGYRAAHTYLALRTLGYPRVRNYTGSWKEWGDRADLPISVD
jgi:thiosulfate/3-mercaptopyruvate sulfurtransferase